MGCSSRVLTIVSFLANLVAADERILTSPGDAEAYNSGVYGQRPSQQFFSSRVRAPRILVNVHDRDKCDPSGTHIITGIDLDGQERSPLILRADDLSMVYGMPDWRGGTGARLQQYNGSSYLSFWSGQDHEAWGSGSTLMLDSEYNLFARLGPEGLENHSDPHEFKLTKNGTALFTNYHQVRGNCSAIGGPEKDCEIWESCFQELDMATRKPVYTWCASEHIALDESPVRFTATAAKGGKGGYDFFHINAVSKTRDGRNYLVNARHTSALMLLDGTTGERIWQLGGRENSFTDLSGGNATNFRGQHHGRFSSDDETEVSFFDNHSFGQDKDTTPGCKYACTRVLRIKLDYEAMTARVLSEWWHPQSVQARAQGGQHVLPGGGAMVAWGVVPALTEYTAEGEVCMDVQVGPWSTSVSGESNVYRAYKLNYTATPYWDPEMAVVDGTAYVSWNGATEVESWVLHGGDTEERMKEIASSKRQGFETAIEPESMPLLVRADALDKNGCLSDGDHTYAERGWSRWTTGEKT
ncbi:ASST-domain-containing protein [Microdochium bolleyi]|uniref:ASST-domain-containing protein n=1 Tax=Microdochium bolleyi TaxID=196109 RepID=A0A136IZL9_9PEZI|nr:ASST-domain-containing protein [Microdochium bolleyi]